MISTYQALVRIAGGVKACNLDCFQVTHFKSYAQCSNVQEL